MSDDKIFERIARNAALRPDSPGASARLKSRIYTALVRAQQEAGPLATLTESERAGRKLCVFEKLVEIAPVGAPAKSTFQCTACHARVLAEHMENPPIWWPHCPYSEFKKA